MSIPPSATQTARPSSTPRATSILIIATVVAVGLNVVVASVALGLGVGPFPPLTLPVYGAFTVLGVLIGWFGWGIVQRKAANPARVLAILVPVVAVLSFVPDVLLMILRYIPGSSVGGAIALMIMHVVVLGTAVPAYILASRSSE